MPASVNPDPVEERDLHKLLTMLDDDRIREKVVSFIVVRRTDTPQTGVRHTPFEVTFKKGEEDGTETAD